MVNLPWPDLDEQSHFMTLQEPIGPEKLTALLDQHARALEVYASQWCSTPEDCVQDAFVRLAGQIPPPENFTAWLYRAVRNQALNAARASRRRSVYEQNKPSSPQAHESDPADLVARRDETRRLLQHLDTLEAEARELVVLRIWSGLTWQQISELTGLSSSSAQRKYVTAIERLGNLLEPSCVIKKIN